jgi:hypothetical protein
MSMRRLPFAIFVGLAACTGQIGGLPDSLDGTDPQAGTNVTSTQPDSTAAVRSGPVVGPSAGRRLTKGEYLNSVSDLLGVDLSSPDDSSVLPEDQPATGGGFRNDIQALLPTAVRTDAYETLANTAAARAAWTGGLARYAACTDPTLACREGFIRKFGRLAYRRPLNDDDVGHLGPLFDLAGNDAAGFQDGARLVVMAMLQSPHFLYRLERLDAIDSTGKHAPSAFELATRLSYMLWGSTPTTDLLDSADRGELSNDSSFVAALDRMIADPRVERGFDGYVIDWLQLYRLDTRTPNEMAGVTPDLLSEMKEETRRFVRRVAMTENRDLTSLFTDKKSELGPALAAVYGVKPPLQGFATYDFTGDPSRIGILTEPGFLILRAAPERATIVHRGLMILRLFLCSEVPAPPANAATRIDMIPSNLTDRERFALHASSATCKACHSAFDPLGEPFEPYDLAGRFRTHDEYGNVLRSDGEVTLDGTSQTFKSTADFAGLLSKSPDVARCFVRKMVQYGLGRTMQDADDQAVSEVANNLEKGGRTYTAMLRAVLTSSALRAPAPVE